MAYPCFFVCSYGGQSENVLIKSEEVIFFEKVINVNGFFIHIFLKDRAFNNPIIWEFFDISVRNESFEKLFEVLNKFNEHMLDSPHKDNKRSKQP